MSVASVYEWQMLALINAERAAVGVDPLKLELVLNSAAEDHSNWMLATDTFSHTGIGGSSAGERITAAGFDLSGNWTWGENLAGRTIASPAGYADEIVALHQQLMNSPGHRENLLNPNFEYIGIGMEVGEYNGNTWALVTQKFARTASDVSLDTANLASHEVLNASDINGDGMVGQLTVDLDTNGIGLQTNISGQYAIVDGNETHVVTLQGVEAGQDSYAGWQAIQAGSDGAGGYSVLWVHDGGTYGVWNLDSTGAQYEFPDASNLVEFEARFSFDINGDGGIGHFSTDLDTNGIGLQSSTRGTYIITDGGNAHVVTFQGAIAGPDSYAGWEAVQAGSDGAGGYSLLWHHESGVYGVWNLDSTGAQYAFPDASNLVDFEDQFAFDINEDGSIGHVSTDLDTNGIGLQSSTHGTYIITDGDDTHVVTYQGSVAGPDSYAGWEAIQAGSDGAGGYSVLWHHEAGVYGVWNLDSTGAQYEFPDSSNLADYEDRFAYDITGDDILG